jgi:hypothetical protein
MKKLIITSILAAMIAAGSAVMAQEQPADYLGLPGDNLNLYAVMKLFQASETIEGFERNLNDENSRINNLDLNGDNQIDYIKVIDYVDGNVHTIVLQDVLGRNESQDVAVFTVQRFDDGSVQIQLTGDEALYGKNYIIEPVMDETPNPGYTGNYRDQNVNVVRTTTVEIAAWPVVRYIYMPDYVIWRSSWYWGYYPNYWHPWHPYYWHYYYGYHYNLFPDYYRYFRHYDQHRYAHWNDFYYTGKRAYSPMVESRIKAGDYRTTYSHPDQRKEGEALFTKDRSERPATMSSGYNPARRNISPSGIKNTSPSGNNRTYQGTVNNGTRRAGGTVNSNTGSTRNAGQNSGNATGNSRRSTTGTSTVPRSPTTVNNRANTNSNAGQGTVNTRSTTNPNAGQGTVNSRRPSETVNTKPVSRPQSVPSAGSVKSSGQQNSGVRSTGRRNRQAVSKPAVKKSTTTKEKENSNNPRRNN